MKKAKFPKATEMIDRLKEFYGYKYDTDLARHLGLSEGSAVGNWRRRDTLDIFLIARKCPEVDLDWLLWGRGEKAPATITNVDLILEKSGLPREQLITLVKEALENYLLNDDKK